MHEYKDAVSPTSASAYVNVNYPALQRDNDVCICASACMRCIYESWVEDMFTSYAYT